MIDGRKPTPTLAVAAVSAGTTGATTGAYADMRGLEAWEAVVNVTEATGLTSAILTLTECDTSGGTYTAVAADGVVGAADGDTSITLTDVGTAKLSYVGNKRYVKAVVTVVATDVDFNLLYVAMPDISSDSIVIPT